MRMTKGYLYREVQGESMQGRTTVATTTRLEIANDASVLAERMLFSLCIHYLRVRVALHPCFSSSKSSRHNDEGKAWLRH